jgi:hypothetical protein
MDKPTQLYRHYDAQGRLLYVGISSSALLRMAAHKVNASWFNDVARIEIEAHPSRKAAQAAEAAAIESEKPLHNYIHNRPKRTKEGEAVHPNDRAAAMRKRRRALGLVAISEWVPAHRKEEFMRIAKSMVPR